MCHKFVTFIHVTVSKRFVPFKPSLCFLSVLTSPAVVTSLVCLSSCCLAVFVSVPVAAIDRQRQSTLLVIIV